MTMTAEDFLAELKPHAAAREREKILRYFDADDEDNRVIGIRMKRIFDLAKQASKGMPLGEIERLLESPYYEGRMGAVSVMDFQARGKTPEERRRALHDLYLDRHDRINSWDMVDRSAGRVIGGYLYEFDQPRDVLYDLARSEVIWERRTAIVGTSYFIRKGQTEDTFAVAEILLDDERDLIHKAIGTWIRHAGQQDRERLLAFLDEHAPAMPRVAVRYATEKLDEDERARYRRINRGGG